MGNKQALSEEAVLKISKETDIKPKEIKKIYRRFAALDKTNKGYVTVDDISKLPEIEKNPLRFYICQYLTAGCKNEDEVNFELFVKLLDIFKNNKTRNQFKFVFDLFDFDKDGKISYEDMLVNIKLLIGNSLNDEQVKEIVEKTIFEYADDQRYVTFEEFLKIVDN